MRFGRNSTPKHSASVIVLVILALASLGLLGWSQRTALRDWLNRNTTLLPAAEDESRTSSTLSDDLANTSTATNSTNSAPANANSTAIINTATADTALPAEKNLKVPFTSQAPLANWDHAHEEACEEASALIVAAYWQQRSLSDKAAIDKELVTIENWEVERFGYYEDTDAAQTAVILQEYFKLPKTAVKKITSWSDIKREVAAGRPVIVPTAGRDLHNPNFTGAGPAYHNLVIKGYLKDGRIITNDPGTRKGADYVYSADVLWNAIHDWTGHAADGDKVMIVVSAK